jgi:ABC-type transporter Mla subunit MlaD
MPNNYPGSFNDTLADESSTLGTKLSDTTTQLKNKASDLGRKAADVIEENMESAAGGLDKAAATLHGRADNLPGVEKMTSLAHSAADKLSATAEYVREHDVDRIMADVKSVVKKNPGASLLAAGVVGFLVGRAFRSSNSE